MLFICQYSLSPSSPRLFQNIGEFGAAKYSPNRQTANTSQLFVAINGNFSGLLFFWTSRSDGEFCRDYLMDVATCLKRDDDVSFSFLRIINKNVLEWFQLIIWKEYTLSRSVSLISKNHLKLCFWLRKESWQMPNTYYIYD